MVHGLSLATIIGRWLGETPFVQVSTTWALTCPETVHQRPCMTREIETWLSDSRVGNYNVVDHRSRRPVLSPLRRPTCVDSIELQRHFRLFGLYFLQTSSLVLPTLHPTSICLSGLIDYIICEVKTLRKKLCQQMVQIAVANKMKTLRSFFAKKIRQWLTLNKFCWPFWRKDDNLNDIVCTETSVRFCVCVKHFFNHIHHSHHTALMLQLRHCTRVCFLFAFFPRIPQVK